MTPIRALRAVARGIVADLRLLADYLRRHPGQRAVIFGRLRAMVRRGEIRVASPTDSPVPQIVTFVQASGDVMTFMPAAWGATADGVERSRLIDAHMRTVRAEVAALGAGLAAVRLLLGLIYGVAAGACAWTLVAPVLREAAATAWREVLVHLAWWLGPSAVAVLGAVIVRTWLRHWLGLAGNGWRPRQR